MINFKNLKSGFTLAEVLITLGIIGVVAAMTLPTLIANYQKKVTVSKLKKVYSVLNQAYLMSENTNGEFSSWDLNTGSDPVEYVQKYWLPYFDGAKFCNSYSDCGYTQSRPWHHQDGNVSAEDVTGTQYRAAIILKDGVVVSFRIPPIGQPLTPNAKVNVDINGSLPPNKTGEDYFWFELKGKGVQPLWLHDYSYEQIDESCKEKSDGGACAAKIMTDGWEMKDDYPW